MSSATSDGKTFFICTLLCGLLLLLLSLVSSNLSSLWIVFGITYTLLSLQLYFFLASTLLAMMSGKGASPVLAVMASLAKVMLFFVLIFALVRLEPAEFWSVLIGAGSFLPGALLFAAISALREKKSPL